MHKSLLFLIVLLATACLDTTAPEGPNAVAPFFDLSDYMETQIPAWEQLPQVTKTASINGEEKTLTLSGLNFTEELAVFSRADINRPAWTDRYAVDSTSTGATTVLTYRALDEDLKTQLLRVTRRNGTVTRLDIENRTDGPVAAMQQYLIYEPLKRYEIRSTQEVILMDSTVLHLIVTAG